MAVYDIAVVKQMSAQHVWLKREEEERKLEQDRLAASQIG